LTPESHRRTLDALLRRHVDSVSREIRSTLDVQVLEALIDLGAPTHFLPRDVCNHVITSNDYILGEPDRPTPKRVAVALRRLGFEAGAHTREGNLFTAAEGQVERLARAMGVAENVTGTRSLATFTEGSIARLGEHVNMSGGVCGAEGATDIAAAD